MSVLGRNISYNIVSQIFVTLVGLVCMPVYVNMLGSESYGLIGVFTTLQAVFSLLDFGLSPTISRETSLYLSGSLSPQEYKKLRRLLFRVFFVIGLSFSFLLIMNSQSIAKGWLKYESLTLSEVMLSIEIMTICCFFRWMCGLYRGVVSGAEKFGWLSFFNASLAALKFLGVFVSMNLWGAKAEVFFLHQLILSIFEWVLLRGKALKCVVTSNRSIIEEDFTENRLKKIWKFSSSIALTSAIWLFITQIDKIVLSGILDLKEYGYFTLTVLLANGIFMISGPISQAVMPRMASLYAVGKRHELFQVYNSTTKYVSIFAGTVSLLFAALPQTILSVWTGDDSISINASNVLRLYSIGNMFLVISAFAYYLQYSYGNLYYHVRGNLLLLILLTPSIVIAASVWGSIGAGYVWVTMNAIFLFLWVAYVHSKLEPGLHKEWIFNNFVRVIFPGAIVALLLGSYADDSSLTTIYKVIKVFGAGMIIFISTLISSNELKNAIRYLKKRKRNEVA